MSQKSNPEPNYFTCTLGEAAEINSSKPIPYKSINDFFYFYSKLQAPAVGFAVPQDGVWQYEIFAFNELHHGSIIAANEFLAVLKKHLRQDSSKFVALICPSSVDFLFSWLGLMRLGLSVLLIAPQSSAEAIDYLCKACDARLVIHDASYIKTTDTRTAAGSLVYIQIPWQTRNEDISKLTRQNSNISSIKSLFSSSANDIAYIHHSSGTSSGIPKPIPYSHHAAVCVLPRLDGEGKATFTTTPLYHGGIADCFRSWTSTSLIWLFPGASLPITCRNVLKCLSITTQAQAPPVKYFSSVPYVLQMLADEEEGMEILQNMDIVGVGGAALPPEVGDSLVKKGINLISRFGSAECGFLLSSQRHYNDDKEWRYLRVKCPDFLQFERSEDGTELYELIVRKGWPHLAKTNREDGSFATSDLFERHSSIEGAWRYDGRSDSQITLVTGKKFDPIPIEEKICASSRDIKDTFVFGNERDAPGIVIVSNASINEGKDNFWSIIQNINDELEHHARIGKGMIIVVSGGEKCFEKSSKGTILRGPTEKRFMEEIETLYKENQDRESSVTQQYLRFEQILSLVRSTVNDSGGLKPKLEDEDDFYQSGIDSTRCSQIRASLQMKMGLAYKLPWNVVYDCGNIYELSTHLEALQTGRKNDTKSDIKEMLKIVEGYSVFPEHLTGVDRVTETDSSTEVVVLTGATGALGATILTTLCENVLISKIICLVRAASDEEAKSRVVGSLRYRRKAPNGSSMNKIQCISSRFSDENLGLSQEMISIVQHEATVFVHAAWAVNFSLPLRSFIPDHIAGLSNILSLFSRCEKATNFTFCSSTASTLKSSSSPIPEVISDNPKDADELGYSKSKWVAEAICARFAAHVSRRSGGNRTKVNVVRVGQLTGDRSSGVWNMSEAWPLMLSTVKDIGCLPKMNQQLDWLPLDVAAQAVVDISFGEERYKECSVYHVLNAEVNYYWTDLLKWIQETRGRSFEVVELSEWLGRLDALDDHPARELIWLWKKRCNGAPSGAKDIKFECEKANRVSQVMRDFRGVDQDLVVKIWSWLEEEVQWKQPLT